jgi:hypothetical protein
MPESRKQVKARLHRQRQLRANAYLKPVKERIIRDQQLRTNARIEFYNDLTRRRNAREYDLDIERGRVPEDPPSFTQRIRTSCCVCCSYFLILIYIFILYWYYYQVYLFHSKEQHRITCVVYIISQNDEHGY